MILDIRENVLRIREEIECACNKSGRAVNDVRLVAATKFVDPERILQALNAGIKDIGENRAQEFTEKLNFYKLNKCNCHYIGQLQTNKVKYICGNVEFIHSVDRLSLAQEISRIALRGGYDQKILLQVNLGHEKQKGGVEPGLLRNLLDEVLSLPNIIVSGLMGIPPASSAEESRVHFSNLHGILLSLQSEYPQLPLKECSMGMSGDFITAIEEGSTMVRVGTGIFGKRI